MHVRLLLPPQHSSADVSTTAESIASVASGERICLLSSAAELADDTWRTDNTLNSADLFVKS